MDRPKDAVQVVMAGGVRGSVALPAGRDIAVAQMCYGLHVSETIAQRQLRNDNAEIMRRVEAGESFVVTRNGRPVAELRPLPVEPARRRMTIGELRELWADLAPISVEQWNRERAEADEIFGPDDIDS